MAEATQKDKPYVKLSAAGDIYTGTIRILYARWVSETASAGDNLLVVDGDGDTVIDDVADGANYTQDYLLKSEITNLTITTMGSGALYLYRSPHVKQLVRY